MKPFEKLEEQVGKKLIAVEEQICHWRNSTLLVFEDSYTCISATMIFDDMVIRQEELEILDFIYEPEIALKYNIFTQEQFDEVNKENLERKK